MKLIAAILACALLLVLQDGLLLAFGEAVRVISEILDTLADDIELAL